jgi:hypothetical protein
LHHDNALSHTFIFTGEFFTKSNITVIPHPPYLPDLALCNFSLFSLFSSLEIELKGCHFDTLEVIEAELQAVLSTLTEHDSQDAFKNGRSGGNSSYMRKETTLRVTMVSRHKASF